MEYFTSNINQSWQLQDPFYASICRQLSMERIQVKYGTEFPLSGCTDKTNVSNWLQLDLYWLFLPFECQPCRHPRRVKLVHFIISQTIILIIWNEKSIVCYDPAARNSQKIQINQWKRHLVQIETQELHRKSLNWKPHVTKDRVVS